MLIKQKLWSNIRMISLSHIGERPDEGGKNWTMTRATKRQSPKLKMRSIFVINGEDVHTRSCRSQQSHGGGGGCVRDS